MNNLRQSVDIYIQRALDALDDMFTAIEARDAAGQHTALAALVGLIEMLRSVIDNGDDEENEE
jgi:hypothetical protein